MNLGTRELRCLLALDDQRSFTDAAIQLGISQAAVSRILSRLEQTVGTRLVARTTRSVSLTEAGERFAAHARRALAEIDAALDAARSQPLGIRLGYAWSALGSHTPALHRRWLERTDGAGLRLVRHNSPDAGTLDGIADVAVVRRLPSSTAGLAWVEVGTESRVCVCAADSSWGDRASVSLAEIGSRTLAVNARTGTTSAALWPAGRAESSTIETDDVDEWLDVIVSGSAVGVTSVATSHHYPRTGIRYLPIPDAPPLTVWLVWPRDTEHPLTGAFIELVTELYRQTP